jgi:competence protein ComEA
MATLGLSAQATPRVPPAMGHFHRHAAARVNLNTATSRELRQLPGVGELLAQRIIAARPFRSLDDLRGLKGLSPQACHRMAPLVTF